MIRLDQNPARQRMAVMLLIAAVAMLPLLHLGEARASSANGDHAVACAVDGCDACDCCPNTGDEPCCPTEDSSEDDRPCDCPCCGQVLAVAPTILVPPMEGPFWADPWTLAPVTRSARPDSAVVSVDIQPPIL